MRARTLTIAGLAATVACLDGSTPAAPPVGQIVLHVDTDAPVVSVTPQPVDFTLPIPLFDRIRFDVTGSQAAPCDGCTQDFALTSEDLAAGSVSIGVTPPPGDDGWTARVRIYALRLEQPGGEPDVGSSMDLTVALPAVAAEGIVDVSVVLSTDDTGQPVGQDTPVSPTLGAPAPSVVGSWAAAVRTPCSGNPPSGMVCVPGGAFLMGPPVDHLVPGALATWHRLVVLSPFFLDRTEVTGTQAAAGGIDTGGVATWSGGTSGSTAFDWCTWQDSPGSRAPLPLNCVLQSAARGFCKKHGGDLPTEAQFEYVMGGLAMTPFVWGGDPPQCGDAVWGRNGFGPLSHVLPLLCLGNSVALGAQGGHERPGSAARDSLPLPGGPIVDLTGNLEEWARDDYQTQAEPCWSVAGVMNDPVCTKTSPSLGARVADRGGSWSVGGTQLEASGRTYSAGAFVDPSIGFRCMKSAM